MTTPVPSEARQNRRWKRLGPLTWVPELGVRHNDPWAHRKSEPRPLALLWSMYLMVAALVTIFRVKSLTMPTTGQFVFACRGMIVLSVIGSVVLWPALRLCQERPSRPRRAVLMDLAVILLPMQAVIWPMPLLTSWPWEVVLALQVLFVSWAALAAAILVRAFDSPSGLQRAGTALLCILLAAGAPVLIAMWPGGGTAPDGLGMLSPISAAFRLVEAPNGLAPAMTPWEWLGCAWPALPALVGFLWPSGKATPARPDQTTDEHPLAPASPSG